MAEQEQKRAEQRPADGGTAFPPAHDPDTHAFGMTLRHFFAAKALQGLLAAGVVVSKHEYARRAFELADAMLDVEAA